MKKIAIPFLLVSLGIFAATQNLGCSSSPSGGTGGAGGSDGGAKGGATGTGGKATGGTTGAGGKTDGGTAGTGAGGTAGTGAGGKTDGGTAGTGAGGTAGTGAGGTAGTGAGGKVDGGTAGTGAGGTAGTGAGGTAGSGTDSGTDAPADAPTDGGDPGLQKAAQLCPNYPNALPDGGLVKNMSMNASDWCLIYLSLCAGSGTVRDSAAAYDMNNCMAMYNGMADAGSANYGTKQTCESVHVCNAWNLGNPTQTSENVHCPHSEGAGPCAN